MGALLRELGEEVFVNAAEHVARCGPQGLGIKHPQHALEKFAVEALVVLRQLTGKRWEMLLDGFHGGHQRGP